MKIMISLFSLIILLACMNPQNESTEIVNDFNFPYDLSKPDKVYELPTILKEISALSIAPNGELACVQDEEGIIFFYNLDQKKITNRFIFGKAGDYEGIEFVGEIVYVLRSDGTIFEIKNLGKTNQIVTTYNTKLNRKNDTEGLGYDAEMNCLLIACKGKAANIQMIYKPKAVYAFDLKTKSLRAEPVMLFSKEILYNYIETNDLKDLSFNLDKKIPFNPSGITVKDGFRFTIASAGKMIIVTDNAGNIQYAEKLDKDILPKPEGITFDENYNLFIASEGKKEGNGHILMFSQK